MVGNALPLWLHRLQLGTRITIPHIIHPDLLPEVVDVRDPSGAVSLGLQRVLVGTPDHEAKGYTPIDGVWAARECIELSLIHI